jgi:hypothetical protein
VPDGITVCGYVDQACPIFSGMVKPYHWGFDDPAKATGSEEEIFRCFSPGARRNRESFRRLRCRYKPGNPAVSMISSLEIKQRGNFIIPNLVPQQVIGAKSAFLDSLAVRFGGDSKLVRQSYRITPGKVIVRSTSAVRSPNYGGRQEYSGWVQYCS